jgi:hypothetical protein
MPGDAALPEISGLSLDSVGPIAISSAENSALCTSMGIAPDPDGKAHLSYYYSATQAGMGLSVTELCARCGFKIEEGPLLASSEAVFHAPLMTGTPYRVRGEVVSLTRKASRKFGVVDFLRYRLRLVGPDDAAVVETTNVWALPRGAA